MPRRLLALAALLLVAAPLRAQIAVTADTPLRPVTRTFALTNARVVQSPGRVLDRATVLIRDGRIEAVGPRVRVPYDAEVIEADSLTVYAGFVDALGHAGLTEPERPENEERLPDPSNPPRERSGVQPERDVRAMVDPKHASFEQWRALGFTAAHTVPYGLMLPGQGAVVLLREPRREERPEAVILTGPISLFAQFEPGRGAYPSTAEGILAVLRERFIEAGRRRELGRRHARDPERTSRPLYDPVLEALAPTLDGERPLFFYVENTNEAFRALRVARELEVPVVLAGVPEATPLLPRLREAEVPVLAPLALPDTVKLDTSDAEHPALMTPTTRPNGMLWVVPRRTASYRDLPAERAAMRAQQRSAVGIRAANAATLAEAEVPFAFTTLGAKPGDVRKNLQRMIAAGLAPDDALAALTTAPARLLGLDRQLGTVEPGRLANLVVTDGDYFDEDTKVRYVFVEGVRYEMDADTTAVADSAVVAVGTWTMEVAIPSGTETVTVTIEGEADALNGRIEMTDYTALLETVTLQGRTLSFRYPGPEGRPVTVTGTITGDRFEGSAEEGGTSFPVTGTRRPSSD